MAFSSFLIILAFYVLSLFIAVYVFPRKLVLVILRTFPILLLHPNIKRLITFSLSILFALIVTSIFLLAYIKASPKFYALIPLWILTLYLLTFPRYLARHVYKLFKPDYVRLAKSLFAFVNTIFIVLWLFAIFMITANAFGYSPKWILSTFGIGTLAVTVAADTIIADAWGGVFLFLDKPFTIGDWVIIRMPDRNIDRSLVDISLRSIKIKTWYKEVVSIPNRIVVKGAIKNKSYKDAWRVDFKIRILMNGNEEKVRTLLKLIRQYLLSRANVLPDIRFYITSSSNSTLAITVTYFIKNIAYHPFLREATHVNLAILQAAKELGLNIAIEPKTLLIKNTL